MNIQAFILSSLLGSFIFPSGDRPGPISGRDNGYRAVISIQEGFLAAGSDGRLDWITADGKTARSEIFPEEVFNCLLLFERQVFAAGDNGTVMIYSDKGMWQKIESGTGKNINSLEYFNGTVLAGTDDGTVLLFDKNGFLGNVPLSLKGNIVSVSARVTECFGVTDAGEIIRSENGTDWDIIDFNDLYSGYYGTCSFTKVLATENRIMVTGIRNDGSPVLMVSHLGGVWTERDLYYTDDQGRLGYLMEAPNDIYYDERGEQFFLICDEGKMMSLSSCSQCNRLTVLAESDLKAIAGNAYTLLIAGENFFKEALNIYQ